MSFIFDDKKLLEELFKSATEFENKFTKKGQATNSLSPELLNYFKMTKKLVDSLESTQFPSPTEVSTLSDDPQPLNVNNANSLGNLLLFLANNEIAVGGKRVAYTKSEGPADDTYLPVNADMLTLVDSRGGEDKKQYYTNKDLLSKYLVSLQVTAKDKKNKILELMVGKLIENVNKIFGTNLSKTYQAPEADVLVGPLTTFPEVLDPSSNKDGTIQLSYSDIESDTSLKNWAVTNKIKIKIGSDEVGPTDEQNRFNWCVVIKTISNKANALLSNFSTTVQLKKRYEFFVNQINKISGSFTGPDGKACSTNLSANNPSGNSQQDGNVHNVGYNPNDPDGRNKGNQSSAEEQRKITKLVSLFPFESLFVNFDKLEAFARNYAEEDPRSSQTAANVIQKCEKMSSTYGVNRAQNMALNVKQVKQGLKNPEDSLPAYLIDLSFLVSEAGKLMTAFGAMFGSKMSPDAQDLYRQQMGSASNSGSSYYHDNMSVIEEWQNHIADRN